MDDFFASSLQAPRLINTTEGNSNFNLQDAYSSSQVVNEYLTNDTEKYFFSDSEPFATPQSFNGGTSPCFLPDFGALPLINSNNNLMEQKMMELIGCIEGEDDATTMLNKNFSQRQNDDNSLQQKELLLEGNKLNNQNNLNFPLSYETPTLIQGETTKYNLNYSKGGQSKPTHVNVVPNSNGQVKTRTRARRGHATDPHSIAERQRREKISTRLKNLQELVPNSNKIDKATMLDEAIEYVKFLQIQVKMLSMSRLGGPCASLPLLTENQTEKYMESSNETKEIMDQEESLGLEREVVRLMECSMIGAVQFLQTKGLCLVPIKLASAISNQNASAI